MAGGISEDTATERYRSVTRGTTARVSALHWEPIFPVCTAKRKMYLYSPYTAEKMVGLVCQTSAPKEHLFGVTGPG